MGRVASRPALWILFAIGWWAIPCLSPTGKVLGQESEEAYRDQMLPLLRTYCGDCHSGPDAEAEWDLDRFGSLEEVRSDLPRWLRVSELIRSRQMPPVDATAPTDDHRQHMEQWLDQFLMAQAKAYANDPGPVLLRRLSNAEYRYSIQDLTGVTGWDPTQQFPEDAAAGEGFTNTGSGQGMSAAMAQKYLDAGKEVATHLVLLPDGIRFSAETSRRDQTDRLLAQIQEFYDRFSQRTEGTAIQLQEVRVETNGGGRLPLLLYFTYLRQHADVWEQDSPVWQQQAIEQGLSPRYLQWLRDELTSDSPLLADLGQRLKTIAMADLPRLVQEVETAQTRLWKFHPVGQLGREGTPSHWMEPVVAIVETQEHQLDLPPSAPIVQVQWRSRPWNADSVSVQWTDLRVDFPDRGQGGLRVPVQQVAALRDAVQTFQSRQWADSQRYLEAVARQYYQQRDSAGADDSLAVDSTLDVRLLQRWQQFLGLNPRTAPVGNLFQQRLENVAGHEAIRGWAKDDLPNLLSNRSQETIAFSTLQVPARAVTVHPSPRRNNVVAWQSPQAGSWRVHWKIQDQDVQCGNGFAWRVESLRSGQFQLLAEGEVDNAGQVQQQTNQPVSLSAGDAIRVIVSPRGPDHSCDTTELDFWLEPAQADLPAWRLSNDVVDRLHDGNPLSDRLGNANVWYLGWEESQAQPHQGFDNRTVLGRWRQALQECQSWATFQDRPETTALENWLSQEVSPDDADQTLRQQLQHVRGPLDWLSLAQQDLKAPSGSLPDEVSIPSSWLTAVPGQPEVPVVRLLGRSQLETGAAQSWLEVAEGPAAKDQDSRSDGSPVRWELPFLVSNDATSRDALAASLLRYGQLFPAALCYRKIVPVDEVVTLTLFHREDHHLQRLMLQPQQIQELDRLWDELLYISQEPLQLEVALEQLIQFATQDRQDLVGPFEAMREPVAQRAKAFVRRQVEAEPVQVQQVVDLAEVAWRRPVSTQQQAQLKAFYQQLRQAEMDHPSALQLLLTRILASPDFLFKLETEYQDDQIHLVDSAELATRLSYFLGSSFPDAELTRAARSGELIPSSDGGRQLDVEQVRRQARRLMQGATARRLATEFACQWLHVRGFDQHNEKNETLFPEFASLRDDMYDETILFFERLFQEDRSILEILGSDRMYLNQTLADHYGLTQAYQAGQPMEVSLGQDSSWRLVSGAGQWQRGGVMGMASVLASQSGASRPSPILRGNWVYETLLGQKLPKPPAGVPILPDELPEGLSARQLIERHSSEPGCANCHVRIDPFGFALDAYDVLGRRADGHDSRTTVEDGTEIDDLSGLKDYLLEQRTADFVRQFSRKLLGFALGRPLQVSDEPLLRDIQAALVQQNFRVGAAVEVIVVSPQFTMKRGSAFESPLDP